MDQPPKDTSEIVPRKYQLELLEDCKKANTILYLPTGSGKTYIATMLVKSMGDCLTKPIGQGKKWTFFIVQSVPLVSQQAGNLRRHLPWNIGTFSGDMNVDFWSQQQWNEILEKCHILVMTAQIYLNNLRHGYMHIKDANLLIFDECHHAVALHPFKQIMQVLHDTDLKTDERPRILGLTATLINANTKNVKEELTKLQITFNATIKTRYDDNIQIFSARPKEFIRLYDEYILDDEIKAIVKRLNTNTCNLRKIQAPMKIEPIKENNETYYLEYQKQASKNFANYFLDIEANLVDGGAYIAYLVTWHFMVEIEKKRKICTDAKRLTIMSLVLSELTITRKMLYDYMNKHLIIHKGHSTKLHNTSPKLKKLIEILSSIKLTDTCLVFVDRRTTAKILYHYIKDYIEEFNQVNIVCEFIVGARGIFSPDCKEMVYKKQQNNDIIKKFNDNVINVLITSEVLEEGVDIQTCNYVIRYDSPKNFPSYIQSKGRARSTDSKFILMVPNQLKFQKTQTEYNKMEEEIVKLLVDNDIDDENNDEKMTEVFHTETDRALLTHEIAISIINRYCYSLPQDRFTDLSPEWYMAQNHNMSKKYKLKLPINSVIKTPIDGLFCTNKKNAKKSAAFNACIALYKIGALDENLMPINIKNTAIFNDLKWFPHWDEGDVEATKYKLKAGTNKMKRMVHIESPTYLHGSYPQVNQSSYLHVLHCVPDYIKLEESKYETFDKLLRSNEEFGILTSNKLPQVSNFPIFLPFGNVNVSIEVNVEILYLDHKSHKELENFHNKLFVDVLGVKDFIARSYDNGDNSYLVVPILSTDNIYNVDWNVINVSKFVETEEPTMEQRKSKFYEEYLKTPNVISPWYRNIVPVQRYIVTDVYWDMTPESSFPTSEYDTYATYFSDKYSIQVAHKNQPMIKVKSLGVSKINYLVPRISTGKIDKRSEYIEILVPEFCTWHKFPSVYWLKALMLPTLLYRLDKLLLAEDLLVKINSLCNIEVEDNANKDTVMIDNFSGNHEGKKKNIILPISETLKYLENSHDNNMVDEWNSNNFPIDIERQKNTTMLDVLNYHTFMYAINKSKSNESIDSQKSKSSSLNEECKKRRLSSYNKEQIEEINTFMIQSKPEPMIFQKLVELNIVNFVEMNDILKNVLTEMNTLNLTNNSPPKLSSLSIEVSKQNIGPKQSDILKVITPPFANDMFNYERMETYGDSFLKFAVSLVLFDAFPSDNEGVLTELKMKLVGNRNLLYVGRNLNLGSYLVVNVFDPNMDWIPPCFGVPIKLKEIIEEGNFQSDVLHQITIPRDNQTTGILSDETWIEIETELLKFKRLSDMPISDSDEEDGIPQIGHSQSDLFLHKQSVSDKMVADCVESLIGTYVYKRGVEVGFKVLQGLGIIPKQFIDTFKPKPIDDLYDGLDFSKILPGYELLERRIGYSFKHKHLLAQALTHPTYQFGFSECYQRLEFLGDAILDFLITTYIIEHCYHKTPGEITDIRSSLVNNITFASLSARIGLHRFILAKSVQMTEAIDRFYEHQQKNNHKIGQEVLYLIEESDCYAAESVDVPKVLGDLFESLIAAIYLDCNRDLNFVWAICYRFLEKEIKEFCDNVPKNPIRILHETKLQPNFSKPDASDKAADKGLGTMMRLEIMLNNKIMRIYGFGQNKKEAKVAAAKMALKNMKKMLS
ncbi:endoribonuclease Dicer isoform X3 [Acyrthosiphon pisum]|uniref:Dicer-2 n=1 Tax=Acyrthosiphon pisum TaxID=7029 RepID=A0A8R2D7I6_ACYPI|nr:endoribonuclease Dicer isoform X3 [Acyrthosiphon pisum]|eukprot:XP_016665099.1 PREDICTED: endoribonuclease Dicer isoform X3 [Acyrthosiphon pisum]